LVAFHLNIFGAASLSQIRSDFIAHQINPFQSTGKLSAMTQPNLLLGSSFCEGRQTAAILDDLFNDCLVQAIDMRVPVSIRVSQVGQIELIVLITSSSLRLKSRQCADAGVDDTWNDCSQSLGS